VKKKGKTREKREKNNRRKVGGKPKGKSREGRGNPRVSPSYRALTSTIIIGA